MTRKRQHLTTADLASLAREAVGSQCTLVAATRLTGGSRKGVYRLAFDDGSTAIAYVWSPQEDYWDQPAADVRDTLAGATGLGVFRAAHWTLEAAGVRTPRLLLADEDAVHLPAYSAVVEDVSGGSLQEALRTDPARGRAALERLAGLLERMRARDSAGHGKAGLVHEGGMPHGTSCAQVVADRAVRDIEEAAARDDRVRVVRTRLAERIRELQRAVRPRGTCTLVHGELGPDHVLLTADGEPALIDIEGLMYFDVEWEHVFLELRFGPHYDVLRVPGLDEDRLRLYRLAMHLNLVAGPLRLLDGDFPDREPMRAIAEANLQRVLSLLRSDA